MTALALVFYYTVFFFNFILVIFRNLHILLHYLYFNVRFNHRSAKSQTPPNAVDLL